MRHGLDSYTAEEEDRKFVQRVPSFIGATVFDLTGDLKAGALEGIIVCFRKAYVLMVRLTNGGHLAVSVRKEDAFSVFQEIMPEISKLTQLIH